MTETVDFLIRAKQEGTREAAKSLEEIERRLNALDRASEDSGAQLGELSGLASGAAGQLYDLAKSVVQVAQDIAEMAQQGDKILGVERAFGRLAEQPEKLLAASRAATKGLVSDFELMEAANKGLLLGLPITAQSMQTLAKVSLILGEAMGQDASKSLNDLITGLGRGSTQILDNVGIIVKAKDAYEAYAKANHLVADELDAGQKKLAMYDAALAASAGAVEKIGDVHDNAGKAVTRLGVAWENMTDSMAKSVAESSLLAGVLDGVAQTLDQIRENGILAITQGANIKQGGLVETIEEFDARLKAIAEGGGGGASLLDFFGRVDNEASKTADKAAKAHEAAAKRAAAEWMKAAEDGRRKWDEFFEKMGDRFSKDLNGWIKQNNEEARKGAEAFNKALLEQLETEEKQAETERQKSNEYEVQTKAGLKLIELQRQQAEHAARVQTLFQGIALLAGTIGGKFGEMLQVVQNIGEAFKDWGKKLPMEKFAAIAGAVGQIGGLVGGKAGAGISGAAGGAMTGAALGGPIGAVIGGVVGLIGGIFGHSKKKAEELRKKQDEAIKSFEQLMDSWKKARTELAAVGATGVNKVLEYLGSNANATAEQLARGADYVAASFAMLRASGMSTAQALAALKPSIDALSAKGALAGTAAEPLAAMANFAAANEGLLSFISGLGETAQALAGFGLLTQDLATKIALDMGGAIQSMVDKGLTYEQALALSAQDLFNLDQAAKQSGVTLDEHTQKLIDDAKAAGLFEGLEDPMKQFVEIQKQMLVATGELVKLFGGALPDSVRKLIDEFNKAQVPGGQGSGENLARGGVLIPRAANGIVVPSRAGGSVVRMGEAGAPELAAPVSSLMAQMRQLALDAAGGGGGAGGALHVHVYVGNREIAREVTRMSKTGEIRIHPQAVRVS